MIKQYLHVVPTLIIMAVSLGGLPALAHQATNDRAATQNRMAAPAAPDAPGAHPLP